MNNNLQLEIVTPFGQAFSDKVENCVLPGVNGKFQVLINHSPLISNIDVGSIKIQTEKKNKIFFATSGGFCEVRENVIKVIVESAEKTDSIDVKRAIKAKEKAEERLNSKSDEVDVIRAELALTRAINRIQASKYTS